MVGTFWSLVPAIVAIALMMSVFLLSLFRWILSSETEPPVSPDPILLRSLFHCHNPMKAVTR